VRLSPARQELPPRDIAGAREVFFASGTDVREAILAPTYLGLYGAQCPTEQRETKDASIGFRECVGPSFDSQVTLIWGPKKAGFVLTYRVASLRKGEQMITPHLGSRVSALRLAAALCLAATGLTLATAIPSSASGLNILSNGGFESGSFTPGWTATNAGAGGWEVSSTGTSVNGVTDAPAEGHYTALYTQSDPTSGVLVSDPFTVPAGSTLSLDFAYASAYPWAQNVNPYDLTLDNGNQWLRVDVIKASAASNSLTPSDILLTLFNSQSGSPATTQSWTTLSASLASLAGQSVEIRVIAVDADSFLPVWIDGVDVTGNLPTVTNLGVTPGPGQGSLTASWAPNGSATGYTCTLMYGFNSPSSFTEQTTGTSCTFSGLAPGSDWGIQVVATGFGLTSAPVSAFGTIPIPLVAKPKPKPPVKRIICRQDNGKKLRSVAGVNPHCPSGYHKVAG
jgi:hypothetical protein